MVWRETSFKSSLKFEGPEGEQKYSSTLSLTSALNAVGGQRYAPAALPPGNRPGTHCTGGWVDPRAGLDGCGKSRPHRDSIPRTVQPLASRYTDYAIPAHQGQLYLLQI